MINLALKLKSRTDQPGDLLSAVPVEVLIEIVCHLGPTDILSLRLASKWLSRFLGVNASSIVPVVLHASSIAEDPLCLETLYPFPSPHVNFEFFLQMVHRERIVERMVSAVAGHAMPPRRFSSRWLRSRNQAATEREERAELERCMKASAFIVYHYLEQYRASMLRHHLERPGCGSMEESSSEEDMFDLQIETSILDGYPYQRLYHAFLFHYLMMSAFIDWVRPQDRRSSNLRDRCPLRPSECYSDTDAMQVLMIGGMDEMIKVLRHPDNAGRRQAIDSAVDRINGRHRSPSPGEENRPHRSRPDVMRPFDLPGVPDFQFVSEARRRKFRFGFTYVSWSWMAAMVGERRQIEGSEADKRHHVHNSPGMYLMDLCICPTDFPDPSTWRHPT